MTAAVLFLCAAYASRLYDKAQAEDLDPDDLREEEGSFAEAEGGAAVAALDAQIAAQVKAIAETHAEIEKVKAQLAETTTGVCAGPFPSDGGRIVTPPEGGQPSELRDESGWCTNPEACACLQDCGNEITKDPHYDMYTPWNRYPEAKECVTYAPPNGTVCVYPSWTTMCFCRCCPKWARGHEQSCDGAKWEDSPTRSPATSPARYTAWAHETYTWRPGNRGDGTNPDMSWSGKFRPVQYTWSKVSIKYEWGPLTLD